MIDYLIVGAGLYGATVARLLTDLGKSVKVIDKRHHIGGNVYDENVDNIIVQKYGAHIFHTSDEKIWSFVNRYSSFKPFTNRVKAIYNDKEYSLPINLKTIEAIYGISDPEKAKLKLNSFPKVDNPKNLEEQALNFVGPDIYSILIKEYTEKQWMKDCRNLPASIIKRLPVRFEFNDRYYDDKYEGIPTNGYTKLVENLLSGIQVELGVDYLKERDRFPAKKIVYTGRIDEYFEFKFGELEYRTLNFCEVKSNAEYFQDRAVVNYTQKNIPWTRIIEHKYFLDQKTNSTIITIEFPVKMEKDSIPYYSVNTDKNEELYAKYLSLRPENVFFGGRLGKYKYFDMDDVINEAMNDIEMIV